MISGLDLNSAEQQDFLRSLSPLLKKAGWVHLPWSDGHTRPLWIHTVQPKEGLPASAPASATNVEIRVRAENRSKLAPAIEALVGALNNAGTVATDAGADDVSINKEAIHIWVGEKR